MDFSSLNLEQRRAVESTEGPVMIIAGPGTGKTKTLISRINFLINEKNVSPSSILALTFTHKAAVEMKERLQSSSTSQPLITTFHALGFDILSEKFGDLKIISEKDRGEVIKKIVKEKHASTTLSTLNLKELSLLISNVKNILPSHSGLSRIPTGSPIELEMTALINDYNIVLKEKNLKDFDDLLSDTFLFLDDEKERKKLQGKYQYILIDEFQDTNNLQYELIKKILNPHQNLFVIGDPLQSIYSFRGANSEIFQKMKSDFPSSKKITLSVNYRSTPEIIKINSQIFPDVLSLQPYRKDSGEVTLIKTMNEKTEADFIITEIGKKLGGLDLLQSGENKTDGDTKVCFRDFAVIYRTHHFSHILGEKFNSSGIPYQIIGGNSPYEQKEIQFIISCLEFLAKKNDQILQTILETSINGLTKKTLQKIQFLQPEKTLSRTVNSIITTFDLLKILEDKTNKLQNLHQFQSTLVRFDKDEKGIEKFLEYYHYLEDHEFYDPNSDKVTLLTMHAAKGLEFDYVFICGFEEGSIPFLKEKDVERLQEEQRLLYVAMTRAKKGLYLLYTKKRGGKDSVISRFKELLTIEEIEDEAIGRIEKWKKKQANKKSQMSLF